MTAGKRGLRGFLADLKRRKVYRAAIFYIVVAAGVVELADIAVPYTELPGWTVGLIFAVALFGFPLVLVLAWSYDVTPSGLERTRPTDESHAADRGTGEVVAGDPTPVRDAEAAAPEPAPPAVDERDPDPRSLAVLPFENVSGTDDVAPLAAGLHGDLLTALFKVPGLTVISRRSVMAYVDTTKRPTEIGRELNVGTLLEGAVQSAAGRLRLNVQLIDARKEIHRWAESYDRELSAENIFGIQTELARRITDSLHAHLGTGDAVPDGSATAPAGRPPTRDLEAYRLYARGQSWLDQRTAEAMERALDAFQRAIELDPQYALAWAGLAETLTLLRWYEYPRPDDAPDPDRALRRALELDPELAEAHVSLGILHALRQHAPAARAALARAARLGPGYAEAHLWLSWINLVMGRPDEALEASQRAVDLNPLAPVVQIFTAEARLGAGDLDGALEQSGRAVELQPQLTLAHYMHALVRYHLRRHREAADSLTRALALAIPGGSPRRSEIRALLALSYIALGDSDAAHTELTRIQRGDDEPPDPWAAGLIHAALGDTDAAFETLFRVQRWAPIASEQVRLFFPDVLGPLRQDRRFDRVLRAVDRSWQIELPT